MSFHTEKVFCQKFRRDAYSIQKNVADDIPAIIIAIDNIVPMFDLYPDMEPFLVTLAREGASFGIYLIYTANSTSGVRYKVQQNIKMPLHSSLPIRATIQRS